MTLLQLEYFTALAENLHYTKTAEQLHISQPSLSYEISELERSLGVSLFSLVKRRVHLTDYGKAFLPFAVKALRDLEAGQEFLQELSGKEALTVRLGYFHSIAADLIPDCVAGFQKEEGNRSIMFRFMEGKSADLLAALLDGSLDLAVCLDRGDRSVIASEKLFSQQLYLAVSEEHPLAALLEKKKTKGVEFSLFAGEPQIMLKPGLSPRAIVDGLYEQEKASVGHPDIRFEVSDCNTAVSYVITGFGVAILPEVPALSNRRVRAFPVTLHGKPVTRDVFLCRRKETGLPDAARSFGEHIRKHTKA